MEDNELTKRIVDSIISQENRDTEPDIEFSDPHPLLRERSLITAFNAAVDNNSFLQVSSDRKFLKKKDQQ